MILQTRRLLLRDFVKEDAPVLARYQADPRYLEHYGGDRTGADAIVVHPYFLGPGNHTRNDIPKLVAAAAARHADLEITISDPLGLHTKLIDVVLERISDATQT